MRDSKGNINELALYELAASIVLYTHLVNPDIKAIVYCDKPGINKHFFFGYGIEGFLSARYIRTSLLSSDYTLANEVSQQLSEENYFGKNPIFFSEKYFENNQIYANFIEGKTGSEKDLKREFIAKQGYLLPRFAELGGFRTEFDSDGKEGMEVYQAGQFSPTDIRDFLVFSFKDKQGHLHCCSGVQDRRHQLQMFVYLYDELYKPLLEEMCEKGAEFEDFNPEIIDLTKENYLTKGWYGYAYYLDFFSEYGIFDPYY